MSWYVYMLECNDKSLYTGITNNITARMNKHKCGSGSKYVGSRLPFLIVFVKEVDSKSQALRLEAKIKKQSRGQKLTLCSTNKQTSFNTLKHLRVPKGYWNLDERSHT